MLVGGGAACMGAGAAAGAGLMYVHEEKKVDKWKGRAKNEAAITKQEREHALELREACFEAEQDGDVKLITFARKRYDKYVHEHPMALG